MSALETMDFTGKRFLMNPIDVEAFAEDKEFSFASTREMVEVERAIHGVIERVALQGLSVVINNKETIEHFDIDLADPDTFAMDVLLELNQAAETNFFNGEGAHIKRPYTVPYNEYSHADFDAPIVLAQPSIDCGYSKYLIESREQLEKFQGLADYVKKEWGMGAYTKSFEVREFIPTPSGHYTSYRIVAAANGDIIAAGLLYSDHTKSQKKPIAIDAKPWEVSWGDNITTGLENPMSPYYLGAVDARSNLSQGGHVVPLMGDEAARPLNELDREVVAAHGIDPDDVQVPAALFEQASFMAGKIAKYYGIAIGMDFIQHADTGEFYHLENNCGPGGGTVNACLAGGKEATTAESQRILLEHCFASIAAKSPQ